MMKNYFVFILFCFFLCVGNVFSQEKDTSDLNNVSAVVGNFELNKSIRMYPNPVGNNLTIESEIPITKIQIFSLLGRLVKEKNSNFRKIQLNDLNSGIYMIKIFANDKSVTKKLIKT